MLANPDPAKILGVAAPGCAMANHLSRQVAGLLGSRASLKPGPPVFESVTGPVPADWETSAVRGDRATLTVIASRLGEPVISRTGRQMGAETSSDVPLL